MISTTILCDGCGCVGIVGSRTAERPYAHLLRRTLNGSGWRTATLGPKTWTCGRKDYCPSCLAAAKRGEPVEV